MHELIKNQVLGIDGWVNISNIVFLVAFSTRDVLKLRILSLVDEGSAFARLRIAQWRLALARQESQINPGHLEADNSRSHAEHRMAGSLYGSRIARQLDPGGTLRAVRPFVKGSA